MAKIGFLGTHKSANTTLIYKVHKEFEELKRNCHKHFIPDLSQNEYTTEDELLKFLFRLISEELDFIEGTNILCHQVAIQVPICARLLGMHSNLIILAEKIAEEWMDTYDTIVYVKNLTPEGNFSMKLEMEYWKWIEEHRSKYPISVTCVDNIYDEDRRWLV